MTLDAVSRYTGYAYAYPHKTAYRELRPPIALRDAWAHERKDALFLYLHVPFCEMRCGFFNLFALSRPREEHKTCQNTRNTVYIYNSIGCTTLRRR